MTRMHRTKNTMIGVAATIATATGAGVGYQQGHSQGYRQGQQNPSPSATLSLIENSPEFRDSLVETHARIKARNERMAELRAASQQE